MLRYVSENRSNPGAVTRKWLLENLKLTTRFKNKIWTNPPIQNHKNSHDRSPQTQHANPEHMY
jgi:hypothetical protein